MIKLRMLNKIEGKKIRRQILDLLKILPENTWAVGGCTRDLYLNCVSPETDIDFVTGFDMKTVWNSVLNFKPYWVSEKYQTIGFTYEGRSVEVTRMRRDRNCDGRHAKPEWTSVITEDLKRRDFTINTLCLDVNGDWFNRAALQDIDDQVIRSVSDLDENYNPIENRYIEDKLRVMRMLRFKVTLPTEFGLEWTIYDPDYFMAFEAGLPIAIKLGQVSQERVLDEMNKVFGKEYEPDSDAIKTYLSELKKFGIIDAIIPAFHDTQCLYQDPRYHPEGDVWTHSTEVAQGCHDLTTQLINNDCIMTPNPLVLLDLKDCSDHNLRRLMTWVGLMHDVGKGHPGIVEDVENTKKFDRVGVTGYHTFFNHDWKGYETIMRYDLWPKKWQKIIADCAKHHMFIMHSAYDHLNEKGKEKLRLKFQNKVHKSLPALYVLMRADISPFFYSKNLKAVEFFTKPQPQAVRMKINGNDLLAMGFTPGPLIGELLKKAERLQLDHPDWDWSTLLDRTTKGVTIS